MFLKLMLSVAKTPIQVRMAKMYYYLVSNYWKYFFTYLETWKHNQILQSTDTMMEQRDSKNE